MTINDSYRTKDFEEIVFWLVNNAELVGAERLGPSCVEFIFANRGTCDDWVAGMQFDDAVSLSSAIGAIKKARKIIHSTP